MKKLLIISTLLFIVGLAAVYLLYHGYLRFNYPSREDFPLQGIDISHHQGEIRWEELRTENLSFVIIKATEGGDYVDPRFAANWANSRKSGYATGAYHFYRLCKSGREQAENFIRTVPVDSVSLPPTIDLEFGGNCATMQETDEDVREIQVFLTLLEQHYKKRPILYATREFYDAYLTNTWLDYPLWIRDIYRQPTFGNRSWSLWQFANRAHLNGIDTYVDLNALNGKSLMELEN